MRGRALALALSLTSLGAVGAAGSDEVQPPTGLNPDHPGHVLYQRHCADCHGVSADGKGARAPSLATPPPDLTRLSERLGDPLTVAKLTRVIDGRRTLRGHPPSEMPVWGQDLLADVPNWDQRERARIQLIVSLAEYLVSIQRRD